MVAVANFGQISSCLSASTVTATFLNVSSLCMDMCSDWWHIIVVTLVHVAPQ